jgi:hypothetical protein
MSQLSVITPSDVNALAQPVQSLFVGVGGDIALWTYADSLAGVGAAASVVFKAVPAGFFSMPQGLSIAGVKSTGTTATNLVAVAGATTGPL